MSPLPRTSEPSPPAVERHGESGFTLMEVIVVIMVIGILFGVLVPSFKDAGTTRRTQAGKAAVISYAEAIEQYGIDHGGGYPRAADFLDSHGPINELGSPPVGLSKAVYGSRPQAVTDKQVLWNSVGNDNQAGIRYVPGAGTTTIGGITRPTSYTLELWVNGELKCTLGSNAGAAGTSGTQAVGCQ